MSNLNIIEPNVEVINKHTQNVWQCSVSLPNGKDKQSFGAWITELDAIFERNKLDANIDVALLTGCETSNGHALMLDGRPTAWISISNYPTENTIQVFVTHEVIHAVHYGNVPEYYFEEESEKNHVGRQLVTEGIATYITQKLLNISDAQSLWSDYLEAADLDDLMQKYEVSLKSSAQNMLRDWNSTNANYFYANDRSDVDKYRSGYYLGRLVIERIARHTEINLNDLLNMPRVTLDELVIAQLEYIAKS